MMNTLTIPTATTAPAQPLTRPTVLRTRGHGHGPITRLVSPSDVGQLIKPFIFLDRFSSTPGQLSGFGWHPHSGIATVTLIIKGEAYYEESSGAKGRLPEGGVEWMQAGNGVWHTGSPAPDRVNDGFQLWVALPPEAENGPASSQYLDPADVESTGPARVILGQYGQAKSHITTPNDMNYLDVVLKAGEVWTYSPPDHHQVAWIAVQQGTVDAPESISAGELVVYAESSQAITFTAITDSRFVLGSAVKHAHDLVLGNYSVHTSAEALQTGEANIRRIGLVLHQAGAFNKE